MEAACVEYRILALEQYWPQRFTLEGVTAVQQDCERGSTSACAWLKLPRVVEQTAHERWRSEPYRGERGLGGAGPLASAAAELDRQLTAKGLARLSDATYSLVGTSDLYFNATVPRGGAEYVLVLVAARGMTFEAKLHAPLTTVSFDPAGLGDEVTARSLRVTWTRDQLTNQVAVHATGSERGDVRFFVYGAAP